MFLCIMKLGWGGGGWGVNCATYSSSQELQLDLAGRSMILKYVNFPMQYVNKK